VHIELTWAEYVRLQRAAGYRLTGRWLATGPEFVRIH